jgi:hypothetical protein
MYRSFNLYIIVEVYPRHCFQFSYTIFLKYTVFLGYPTCISGFVLILKFVCRLPPYACKFLEMCLMITADHGPAVSGAHNTIVCARAGKDLVSSLVSGLLTIVSFTLLTGGGGGAARRIKGPFGFLGIRFRRNRMFLGLQDLDPNSLVRGTDPDPILLFFEQCLENTGF